MSNTSEERTSELGIEDDLEGIDNHQLYIEWKRSYWQDEESIAFQVYGPDVADLLEDETFEGQTSTS